MHQFSLFVHLARRLAVLAPWIAGCLFFAAAPATAADRLILRNLDVITDRTVVALDEDGLQLDAELPKRGSRICWDEVERGTVAIDQAGFNRLLAELGPPLYRVRQRLRIGDFESLAEPAEQLYPRFAGRESQTALMVCQAVFWSRMASGRRESAAEPLARCLELVRLGEASIGQIQVARRLTIDPKTGLTPELLPVWFDEVEARKALPVLQETIRAMTHPRPEGVYFYYATLALTAGQPEEAQRVMPLVQGGDDTSAGWRDLLLAQQEILGGSAGPAVNRLKSVEHDLAEELRPIALYWLGIAEARSEDPAICRDGMLRLLTLPAAYGRKHPELAAAGLYHTAAAMDKLKEVGAAAVRQELIKHYAGTYFAAHASSGSSPAGTAEAASKR